MPVPSLFPRRTHAWLTWVLDGHLFCLALTGSSWDLSFRLRSSLHARLQCSLILLLHCDFFCFVCLFSSLNCLCFQIKVMHANTLRCQMPVPGVRCKAAFAHSALPFCPSPEADHVGICFHFSKQCSSPSPS